jgi:hypothetical protein
MQKETLESVEKLFSGLQFKTNRVWGVDPATRGNEFIMGQNEGILAVEKIPQDAPVVLVMSCWAFADHLAAPLANHRGPILMLGNFDGTWPGLVALLNHSATFWRLGIKHSRAWSETFDDDFLISALGQWFESGEIKYSTSHVKKISELKFSNEVNTFAEKLSAKILRKPFLLGILDAGSCMGMINALLNPALTARTGFAVQYLSQAELLHRMSKVPNEVRVKHLNWLRAEGANMELGNDEANDLTEKQLLEQMAMYEAAIRMVVHYGLNGIGIPYQGGIGGLSQSCACSDLVEGMLNNSERPPVMDTASGNIVADGHAISHGNEGDLGALIPQVLMQSIYQAKGMPEETTLHDVRWGAEWQDKFVWVLLISGGAPAAHFGGWDKTTVYRQPPMYFTKGGGTCSGVSLAGEYTWARVFELDNTLYLDCGLGNVVDMPEDEVQSRLSKTTPVWPIANMEIPGYGRNEMMATHMSNHIVIGRGNILAELAATSERLGFKTRVVGDVASKFLS